MSETPTAALAPLSVMRSIEEGQGLGPWARAALSVLLRQSVQGEAPDGVWCFRVAEGVDAMVVVPLSVCSGVPLLLLLLLPSPVSRRHQAPASEAATVAAMGRQEEGS